MATLDDSTLQAVNNANFKSMAEASTVIYNQAAQDQAMLRTQLLQNAVSHQKRVDGVLEIAMTQAIKGLIEMDPSEALSQVKAFTGNDVASSFGALGTAVAAIQEIMKGAQSTPPQTAKPA